MPVTGINPIVVIAIRNSLDESIQGHNSKIARLSREVPVSGDVVLTTLFQYVIRCFCIACYGNAASYYKCRQSDHQ